MERSSPGRTEYNLRRLSIAVQNGFITEVAPETELLSRYPQAKRLDAAVSLSCREISVRTPISTVHSREEWNTCTGAKGFP